MQFYIYSFACISCIIDAFHVVEELRNDFAPIFNYATAAINTCSDTHPDPGPQFCVSGHSEFVVFFGVVF